MAFYALRFLPFVDMRDRKHELTQPHGQARFESWVEADDARIESPASNLLEVVGPREPRAAVAE